MGVRMLRVFFLLFSLFITTASAQWVEVKRVIDGDTFETIDGQIIRVWGIDTPETKHPTKGKEYLGEEATEFAKNVLTGQLVYLRGDNKDKYGRRLASVELLDGTTYALRVSVAGYDKLTNYRGYFPTPSNSLSNKPLPSISIPQSNIIQDAYSEKEWVRGYYKNDGTYVEGYYRAKTNSSSNNEEIYQSTSGYNGSSNTNERVNVKGYYRKDGTYVKPHTRSKSK